MKNPLDDVNLGYNEYSEKDISVYDYNDVPTIRRFALDNSRIRALQGPFGPLSHDTEYLGKQGWKPICEYTEGDEIVQFCIQDGTASLCVPDHYIVQPCDEFIHFESDKIDMMLSPEHRVLVKNPYKRLVVKTAEEIYDYHQRTVNGSRDLIPVAFHYRNKTAMDIGELELRLTVAVIADGSFHRKSKGREGTYNTKHCCVGFRKDRKKERLRFLLTSLKIPYTESPSPSGTVYFYFEAPIKKKSFDETFWLASYDQRKIICDEIRHWDGSRRKDGIIEFYSTSKADVDFIQYCFASTGVGSSVRVRTPGNGCWGKKPRHEARSYSSQTFVGMPGKKSGIHYEQFGNGFKYCFATQTGFFVARRNGKIFVTGNSGKSSGCVMEIVRRAHEQMPMSDGVRRTRWAVIRNCYDDETEVLTEKNGWRLFKDVEADDRITTLDGNTIVYMEHDGIRAFPYEGEMIGFEGESVDFCVTPEHKMWISKRRTRQKVWGDFEVATAEEVYGSQLVRVKRDAEWRGVEDDLDVSFYEFLGFWYAEGSCGEYEYEYRASPRRNLNITQTNYTLYIENLMKRNGIVYSKLPKQGGGYRYDLMQDKRLMEMFPLFLAAGKQIYRKVPVDIKSATPDKLRAFIHGYWMGDGHKTGSMRLCTSSKQLADDLQEMALKAGLVANVGSYGKAGTQYERNGRKWQTNAPHYYVTLLSDKKYRPILRVDKNMTNHLKGWYKKPYNGTVYCVQLPLVPIYVRRRGKGLWCLRTNRQLRDTTIKTFFQWVPPHTYGTYKVQDFDYYITEFDGCEIEVMFRSLDRPDHIRNLLSLELTGAWINEYREMHKDIFFALEGRIDRYPSQQDGGNTWGGIFMDTNPPEEGSFWYRYFEEEKPEGARLYKQPSGLSPMAENIRHLKANYYENLARNKPEQFINMYVHGKYGYTIEGKSVYPAFNDSVHVASSILMPIPGRPLMLGFDFALNPSCVVCQLSPRGQLFVLDEVFGEGMGIDNFLTNILNPLMKMKYKDHQIIGAGDPSGMSRSPTDESTCFDVLWRHGYRNVRSASSNSLVARIGAVEAFLTKMVDGNPSFLLSPHCTRLRKGFNGGYRRKQIPGTEDYYDQPEKNVFSHCFVDDTKVKIPSGDVEIQYVMPGDMVTTPLGDKMVTNTMSSLSSDLVKVTLSNGVGIVCTTDHPFIMRHGVVMAGSLWIGDVVVSHNELNDVPGDGIPWIDRPTYIPKQYLDAYSVVINAPLPKHRVTVIDVIPLRKQQRVFDLTVADAHCFYANGVLVGNCQDALQYACLEIFEQEKGLERRERIMASKGLFGASRRVACNVTGY